MKLFETFQTDDRAVSPVLGVALLIAMTVILAGVVGYVALGVDAGGADAPQASLEFKQAANDGGANYDVSLVHKGGSKVDNSTVVYRVDGGADSTLSSDLTTGKSVTLGTHSSDEKITVLWQDPDSDREVLLAEYVVE